MAGVGTSVAAAAAAAAIELLLALLRGWLLDPRFDPVDDGGAEPFASISRRFSSTRLARILETMSSTSPVLSAAKPLFFFLSFSCSRRFLVSSSRRILRSAMRLRSLSRSAD